MLCYTKIETSSLYRCYIVLFYVACIKCDVDEEILHTGITPMREHQYSKNSDVLKFAKNMRSLRDDKTK